MGWTVDKGWEIMMVFESETLFICRSLTDLIAELLMGKKVPLLLLC